MAATNLIVDFLVIGVTSIVWIVPILLGFFGSEWLSLLTSLGAGPVQLLVVALYALGIPLSRVADDVTGSWNRRVRDQVLGPTDGPHYHKLVNRIVVRSESAAGYLSYRRAIVRMSRGHAFNFGLGALCWIALEWLKPACAPQGWKVPIAAGCVLMFLVMIRAWHVVLRGYFHSVRDIYSELPKSAGPGQLATPPAAAKNVEG